MRGLDDDFKDIPSADQRIDPRFHPRLCGYFQFPCALVFIISGSFISIFITFIIIIVLILILILVFIGLLY
jgi:Ca2+-dependent lipid-binding protein